MGSNRAKIYATKIVENMTKIKPVTKKILAIESGYSVSNSRITHRIEKTKDFQETLEKLLPKNKSIKRISEIIDSSDENVALKATDQANKIHGLYDQLDDHRQSLIIPIPLLDIKEIHIDAVRQDDSDEEGSESIQED